MSENREPSTHERLADDAEIVGSSNRSFGVVIAVALAVVASFRLGSGLTVPAFLYAAALLVLVLAFAAPAVLAPANRLWTRLGIFLSRIVNPIVLGVLYFGFITPFAILLRLSGKDLLRLARSPDTGSYWILREPPGPPPETMKRQF